VVTFAAVIAVHTISQTSDPGNVAANGLLTPLHFTRSMFFFLTGFVLVYTYRDRPLQPGRFLRRRLTLVGVPYLAWTVLYFGLQQVGAPPLSAPDAIKTLWEDIYRGIGWYQLYFLLVSMQFYVLFPLVMRLLHAARRHHAAILGVSLAVQFVVTSILTYAPAPPADSGLGDLWANQGTLVVSYQFYLLAGCVAAYHFEAFQAWIDEHRSLVVTAVLATLAFSEAWYFTEVAHGVPPWQATSVLGPEMVPWFCAVVLGLYLLGSWWSRRTPAGSAGDRLVAAASTRSFGVFLVHPVFIWFFNWLGNGWLPAHLPPFADTVGTYVFTVGGSLAFVEVVLRSPLSKVLIGRERLAPKASTASIPIPSQT
jgi:peptidoglycan/LPS O-acetylase OafA/YrhL